MGGESKPPPRLPSRARKAAECETTEQRVEHIARLMSKGRWNGYATRMKLVEAWGVTDDRVRQIAAEASRLLRVSEAERDELRANTAAALLRIARKAERMTSNVSGLPDWKAAIEALEKAARYQGVDLDADAPRQPTGAKIEIVLAPEDDANADRPVEVQGSEPGVPGSKAG